VIEHCSTYLVSFFTPPLASIKRRGGQPSEGLADKPNTRSKRLELDTLSRPVCNPYYKQHVTPTFLAPNKPPNKSRVFSKLSRRAHLPPLSKPRSIPFPRRACRESHRHRPHPGRHPRVPPQRRGRPPRRESRTAAVPPTGPPRHHRRPENPADARRTGKPTETLPLIFP
jgi:hypothetical protein